MGGFKSETEAGVKSGFLSVGKIVAEAFAGVKVFDFAKDIVGGAADVQKSVENIKAQFGSAADGIVAFNKSAADSFGISADAGDSAASKFGLLFSNIHVATGAAAEMTIGWEKLAGSIAQIKGVDPSTILDKLPLAAAGNTRALKAMGIVVDTTQEKLAAFKLGLIGSVKDALTPATKAEAIYAIATQHLGKFQQEAAAHSGDLTNQQIKLRAEWSNAKDDLGKGLLPVLAELTTFLADNLPAAVDVASQVVTGFAGVVESVVGTIKDAFSPPPVVSVRVQRLEPQLLAPNETVWQRSLAVMEGAAQRFADFVSEKVQELVAYFQAKLPQIEQIIQEVSTTAQAIWSALGSTITRMTENFLGSVADAFRGVLKIVDGVISLFLDVFTGKWTKAWHDVTEILSGALDILLAAIRGVVGTMLIAAEALGKAILDGIVAGWHGLVGKLESELSALGKAIQSVAGEAYGWALSIGKQIVSGLIDGVKNIATGLGHKIAGGLKSAIDFGWSHVGSTGAEYADRVIAQPLALSLPAGWDKVIGKNGEKLGGHIAKTIKGATDSAKTSLETSFVALDQKAGQLGTELTGSMEKALAGLRKQVSNAVTPADVANARAAISKLSKEIGGDQKALREQISLTRTFDGLTTQVKKLGEDEPPAVAASMKKILAEIGNVTTSSTPQQIARIKTQMTNVKTAITTELDKIKTAIQNKQSVFSSVLGELVSAADADFQRATQKVIADMQVVVTGFGAAFKFGGSQQLTPSEILLQQIQDAHDAAQQQTQLQQDQAQELADQQAGNDAATKSDQAQVGEDLYQIRVAALQKQAAAERAAATAKLQDAQDAYQDDRNALQSQMDQRLEILTAGLTNGTIAAKTGMDQLTAVFSDPSYGLSVNQAAFALGGNLYDGLSQGLAPVFTLLQGLVDLQAQVGIVSASDAAGAASGVAKKIPPPSSSTGKAPSSVIGLNPGQIKTIITEPIVSELQRQTGEIKKEKSVSVTVRASTGMNVNQAARDALR